MSYLLRKAVLRMSDASGRRLTVADIGKEPFRLFFPAGVLAGMIGVSLWPLHFANIIELYPGQAHARLMAFGLFGAFIVGFLGTAMPRLLSAPPLGVANVIGLLLLYTAMVASFAVQQLSWGDHLFLGLLLVFAGMMVARVRHRQDTPPPGFVLVLLAIVCVLAGAVLSVVPYWKEDFDPCWIALQRLLSYQGFVLLPILGIGPFLLPRFFGLPSSHSFPEGLIPPAAWRKKALLALTVGILIIVSFFAEVEGWFRTAHAVRFAVTALYILLEFPFNKAPKMNTGLGLALRIAFGSLVAGFILIAAFPAYRVSLLHLTLIGGFSVVTFAVATRVVFGHSGNLEKLQGRNWGIIIAVGIMLFAMVTRISGDFWPKIMASHYSYGAIFWIAGVLLWSCLVLPKVLVVDTE
jgi:uncharacterized protein involved in response to NO